jgi:hypothetical protein
MMKNYKWIFASLLSLIFSANAYSAVIVIDSNQQLIGADDITFDGYTGSVRFLEGSCVNLFNGCDETSDIIFQSLTSNNTEAGILATAANQALLDQAFNASPYYDENIAETFGCAEQGFVALIWCRILTPAYLTENNYIVTAWLTNQDDRTGALDTVALGQGYLPTDSTEPFSPTFPDRYVYASWSLVANNPSNPVPSPSTTSLLLIGVVALGLRRYRKHSPAALSHT